MEDETHFMLFCPVYDQLRDRMWKELEKFGVLKHDMTTQKQLCTLIGDELIDHPHYMEIIKIVMKYIEKAMLDRKKRQGVKSGKYGYSAPSL